MCLYCGSNQSFLKEISPEYSLEGLMLKLKLRYFGHWCKDLTHLKRPWCWERLKVGGEGNDRGWDGWMASLTQWTWVWVNSGSWWWTGRPGVLQSMGSQRVRHDWATELRAAQIDDDNSLWPSWDYKREPKLQSFKSHPWSGHAAWDLFPVGTPDMLCHGTPQHWLSLDVDQNPI